MPTIIIDEEFRSLLPTLDKDTYASLEANIIANGCRDSLVLWNDILLDGHNRYAICTEHDIPFNTVEKEFDSREAAVIWVITNQISRRNMNPTQLSYFRGLHYRKDKVIVTNASGKNQWNLVEPNNWVQPKKKSTASRLSEQYNVTHNTVLSDAKASEAADAIGEVSPEAKQKILSGEVKIDKKVLVSLASAEKEELKEIAAQIEDGTYAKIKPEAPAPAKPETPLESVLSDMKPLGEAISSVIGSLDEKLAKITKKADRTKLKTALRAFIDKLEEQYGRL